MSCRCYRSVSLLHGAVGWSAVCDCGVSWSYSLTFWESVSQYPACMEIMKLCNYAYLDLLHMMTNSNASPFFNDRK